jgi:hypothetical protein
MSAAPGAGSIIGDGKLAAAGVEHNRPLTVGEPQTTQHLTGLRVPDARGLVEA